MRRLLPLLLFLLVALLAAPTASAQSGLANRLNEVEELVAEQTGRKPSAEVRRLERRGGPDSAGG